MHSAPCGPPLSANLAATSHIDRSSLFHNEIRQESANPVERPKAQAMRHLRRLRHNGTGVAIPVARPVGHETMLGSDGPAWIPGPHGRVTEWERVPARRPWLRGKKSGSFSPARRSGKHLRARSPQTGPLPSPSRTPAAVQRGRCFPETRRSAMISACLAPPPIEIPPKDASISICTRTCRTGSSLPAMSSPARALTGSARSRSPITTPWAAWRRRWTPAATWTST